MGHAVHFLELMIGCSVVSWKMTKSPLAVDGVLFLFTIQLLLALPVFCCAVYVVSAVFRRCDMYASEQATNAHHGSEENRQRNNPPEQAVRAEEDLELGLITGAGSRELGGKQLSQDDCIPKTECHQESEEPLPSLQEISEKVPPDLT